MKTVADNYGAARRTSVSDCVKMFEMTPFHELGAAADAMRRDIHGSRRDTVTFILDRNVTYTNICECKCRFCAFFRTKTGGGGYVLSMDEILRKIDELAMMGGTQIMLQGGLNPDLGLDFYVTMLSGIKKRYPKITLHSLSPPEIDHIARKTGKSLGYVFKTLRDAGLDSLPGGGGEILVDRIRKIVSPNKIMTARWLQIMREAHKIGMKTTATMVFGLGETIRERFKSMERVRRLQDETGGFRAFIPWPFSPNATQLSDYRPVGGVEYLKTLAIARLFFDNIKNIASGWVTEGLKIAQLGLAFGANDLGGVLMEEKVVRATGNVHEADISSFVEIARGAGFKLARRNSEYKILEYIDSLKNHSRE